MSSIQADGKPHAVCVPFPCQGDINPMLMFSKLLHRHGFHITFVHSEFNYRRLLRSHGPHALDGLPDFRFRTIPDGLPPSDEDSTQDIPSLCSSTQSTCFGPFCELVREVNEEAISPSITCIVADASMSFALDVAKEFGLPNVVFWAASACAYLGYFHIPELVQRGLTPATDPSRLTDDEYMNAVRDSLPGPQNLIRFRDLPSFVRATDRNDPMIKFLLKEIERCHQLASAIIINTFDAFESKVFQTLSSMNLPPLYSIGPLNLLFERTNSDELSKIGSSLWKEESECFKWLDSREPDSVVYVNFGSITVISMEQLVEFAWGLANSKKAFLWVVRPDLIVGESAVLPAGFLEETKDRGMLARWCPQEEVLKHPAVGGFLSHMGWNSTLESVCGGVPMLCWPFFADQQINCRFACREWGIGMEICGDVKRGEVERLLNELMEGKESTEMRMKATEWKKMAELALGDGGSSRQNLEDVIQKVCLKIAWEKHCISSKDNI